MILSTSSGLASKMLTPVSSLPSAIGQTIGFRAASRRAKFRLPCSQMTFATHGSRSGPGGENFGPAFRTTIVYGAVDGSASRNISSVTTGKALSSVYFMWLDGSFRQPDDMTLGVDEVGEGEVVARDLHSRDYRHAAPPLHPPPVSTWGVAPHPQEDVAPAPP